MSGVLLGDAVLELSADLGPLDRDLAKAENRIALWAAATQRLLDRHAEIHGNVIAGMTAHTGSGADSAVAASRRATEAYLAEAAAARQANAEAARMRFGGAYESAGPRLRSDLERANTTTSDLAARLSAGGHDVWGVNGPSAPGSVGNPIVVVLEAASRTHLGSLAAAIGETSTAAGGSERTTTQAPVETQVVRSGPSPELATLAAALTRREKANVPEQQSAHPTMDALVAGAASRGAGHRHLGIGFGPFGGFYAAPRGGGGGGGGVLGGLLMGGGGLVGGTAALGSLGAFAGLGAEHILTTGLGLAGSAAGGAIGGGLLGLGSLGQLAVGAGSNMAVMKSTIADTEALYKAQEKVNKATAEYGANSKQAKEAQIELNTIMAELGNTAGVKAEAGLAKQTAALNQFWDKATSNARLRAVEILSQAVMLGHEYVPRVAAAAEQNLAVINERIKPLFSWLKGPQGIQIWNDLEDNFKRDLPAAIHAGTQGIEFFGRLTDIASNYTGGLTRGLDHLFTRLNSMNNVSINEWVQRMLRDFRAWESLIKLTAEDIYLLFHRDVGTGTSIVLALDHMLERLREYEKSTKGQAQILNIFAVHKEEVLALLHLLTPLAAGFGHVYMAIAPALVEAFSTLTKVAQPVLEVIAGVAKNSQAAALMLGGLLIAVKAFGGAAVWQGLKTGLKWLTGAEYINAAAANADAAATGSLVLADEAEGGAGLVAGAGAAGATAGEAGGLLGGLGARGAGAATGAGYGIAKVLQKLGMGGAAYGAANAGEVLAPLMAGLVPALAAGGAGFVGSNLIANLLGIHGAGKGLLEGTATGAATGAMLGSAVPGVGTAIGAVGGGAIGGATGLAASSHGGLSGIAKGALIGSIVPFAGTAVGAGLGALGVFGSESSSRTVSIESLGKASERSSKNLYELAKAMEHAGSVKMAGVEENKKILAEQIRALAKSKETWVNSFDTAWKAVHDFTVHSGPALRELADRFDTNMRLIAHTMGLNSATGRKLAEENVEQMVTRLSQLITQGKVPIGAGMQAIGNVIDRYSQATGDQTTHIYEKLFSNINTQYKHHEINTATAFGAIKQIATRDTTVMQHEVTAEYDRLKTKLEKANQDGYLSNREYAERSKRLGVESAKAAAVSMGQLTASIIGAMEAGSLTTKQGLEVLHKDLNSVLTQFGGKPLSMPELAAYVGTIRGARQMAGNVLGAMPHAAGGALVQFGQAGDRGVDNIPALMGGTPIMVGSGEVGAVLTGSQQQVANAYLSPIGGLEGLFNNVTRPHYMAGGGLLNRMVTEANYINAQHFPYEWGGGHVTAGSPTGGPGPGYDCSGSVSAVLHAAGLLQRPEVSGELMNFGAPGPGEVTIYANPVHTFMSIGKHFFGTHGAEGAGWYPGSALPGFAVRHVPLGAGESLSGMIHAPGVKGTGAIAALARSGLGKAAAAANHYVETHGFGMGGAGPSEAHGRFDKQMLERLWVQAGGAPSMAHLMAAIALAESAGDPQNIGPPTSGGRAEGLWQIMWPTNASYVPGGNPYNPLANAKAAVAILKAQGLGAWETYTNGAYRQYMGLGGLLRHYARGGLVHAARGFFSSGSGLGRTPAYTHTRLPKASTPRGVVHAKKGSHVTAPHLSNLIRSLSGIPGMKGIADMMLGPEAGLIGLSDEQTLVGSMTSNAASILPADMHYLLGTILPGENIHAGMLVPKAEREYQRALQTHGESEGLTLQGQMLSWIGGLDDHRLLTGQDASILNSIKYGVHFSPGYPVFSAEQSILEAELARQRKLVHVEHLEQVAAMAFIAKKKHRAKVLAHLMHVTFMRYMHLKAQIARLTTAGLRRRLHGAEVQEAKRQRINDAEAQREALQGAIANERNLPRQEQNQSLIASWEAEQRRLSGYVRAQNSEGGEAVSSAREALLKNHLTNELHPLEQSLRTLGGSSTSVGKSGEHGEVLKQIKELEKGNSELGAKRTESLSGSIPQLQLSISGIKNSLAEAAESVAPAIVPGTGATSSSQEEINALLKRQNEELVATKAVLEAQYKVFGSLPPSAARSPAVGSCRGRSVRRVPPSCMVGRESHRWAAA